MLDSVPKKVNPAAIKKWNSQPRFNYKDLLKKKQIFAYKNLYVVLEKVNPDPSDKKFIYDYFGQINQ